MKRSHLAILVIILSLTVDQILKIWIKTTMTIGEEHRILGNWFILHFIENNGMAFGFELAGEWGKIILSLFRLAAIGAISYYLITLVRKEVPWGLVVAISLILAGASGNIIDSAFYGLIFSESTPYKVATLFPEGGGYHTFLHGRVVDMLYFPIIKGYIPEWSPVWPERYFVFFRPVFNIADSCITAGVFMILIFQKRYFRTTEATENTPVQEGNNSTD